MLRGQQLMDIGQQAVRQQHALAGDPERIQAVRRCEILDTSPEAAFDELTFLASQICHAPIAVVAIVDETRCWFKSKLGVALEEVQDDFTLCAHTLAHDVFTISDALQDIRFSSDPFVSGDSKIRFYAGAPLITPDGFAVGTLCVMDHLPRTLNAEQLTALKILGHQASRLVALRHKDTARLLGSTDRGWARLLSSYDDFVSEALKGFASRSFAVGAINPLSIGHDDTEFQGEGAATRAKLRNTLLQQLAVALDQNELTVHFQPKINLQSKGVTGFEALVRWLHPSLGFVLPDEFIPLAEASGQIAALTPWVIEQTVTRAQTDGWPDRGLQVSVNLSACNLHEATLPDRVDNILRSKNFPAASLTLEITESAVMSDFAGALDTLNKLREIGVSLSVDDFGTGYSSLAYLKELPLQELKIDRALIANVHRSQRDSAIVKFAVDLAHNLGMSVVGEGVEEVATLQTLTEIGCDSAQGFAVGSPMRPAEVATWLQTH
jgi:EAL domain-containing protein (putative c-di-GMP-specific phosphodiesterase class I)